MICSKYVRVLLLVALSLLPGTGVHVTAQSQDSSQANTTVHLRWGARPGVLRYRLQLANDSSFRDIVFDRVITGNETTVEDLVAGRYFWRIAPLTTTLGDFSSAGIIEVTASREPVGPSVDQNKPRVVTVTPIVASGGWRAAVGDISQPVLAHLRSSNKFDVVGTNSDGVTYALDATTGVALWSFRTRNASPKGFLANAPLIVSSRSQLARLDDVVVFAGAHVSKIEGATGRELWSTNLPNILSCGAALNGSKLVFVDSSLQRLFIVNEIDGRMMTQVVLAGRVIGAPASLGDQTAFMLAYDTGHIEIRDSVGAVIRSGDAGSPVTTAPIFIRSATGNLVLVGTRDGLTALAANELRPLGRVALKNDAPRGVLVAQDLDGDGIAEVIMTTVRGSVVVIKATDGTIAWNVPVDADGGAVACADVNGDHVLDVFVTSGQTFAVGLSGRDGSTIWKDPVFTSAIANHASTGISRSIVAIPYGTGALLIASEPSHTGLRAIAFVKAEIRPNPR
jgi:outer membrane protein assembly factor BamB